MRKPVVDYRKFRLTRLNDPQFSHLKLLGGWLAYFAMYFLTENLIPASVCHPMHSFIDDLIPFNEYFVIFYVSWYALIVISLVYFMLYNIESFKNLSKYIMITQAVAMMVYIIYPSRQDLRPETFADENFCTWLVGLLYSADTNTGVCPSLHVAYSLGIASVWLREKSVRPWFKALIVVWVVLICLSTTFIKQHSSVDVIAALPLGLLAEIIVFKTDLLAPKKLRRRRGRQ